MLIRPLSNEIDQSPVNHFWMRRTQEMGSAWNSDQISRLSVDKELDLLLRITDRIHSIICPMKPEHWATNIKQTAVKSIPLSKIDGSHPGTTASFIALVIGLDGLLPKVPGLGRTVLAEANVYEEVAVVEVGFEVRGGLGGCPLVYRSCTSSKSVPAT